MEVRVAATMIAALRCGPSPSTRAVNADPAMAFIDYVSPASLAPGDRVADPDNIIQIHAVGADWRAYQAAVAESGRQQAAGGAADDPRWIHTDAYDAAQRVQLSVYSERFDAELGTGGWNTINRAHYARITRVLDRHRGEGARILITDGAAHKSWMLPRLRARGDLAILDVVPFLDQAKPARP
jgi:hypothetical protein